MKKQLNFILAIGLLFLVSSCENNREPDFVLKEKYYFTDIEVSSIFAKCTKCHDGVAPLGKKVNVLDYAKVNSVWVNSTSGYESSALYKAVKQPGGTMIGAEFGGISINESLVIIQWLKTGAAQSK